MNADYDLDKPIEAKIGLRQELTSYGDAHFSLFLRKVFIKALGYSEEALEKPIIGIVNTFSGFNPCHANVPQLIEAVKRGVHLNGGLAVEFPTISIHESFSSPTSMYLRNLMSMDTEEMIRAQPCDAVVLIGGRNHRTDELEQVADYIVRMRQDNGGAADGWNICQQAHSTPCDRPDDDREIQGCTHWCVYRLP